MFLDAGAMSCVSKSVYASDLGAVIRQAARGTVFRRPEPPVAGPTVFDHGASAERPIRR